MASSHFLEVKVTHAGMGSVENASTATVLVVPQAVNFKNCQTGTFASPRSTVFIKWCI